MAQWQRMQEMQVTQIQSLGQEDPLEEEIATHSSILAWKVPQTEEPGGLQSMRSKSVRQDWSHWPWALNNVDMTIIIILPIKKTKSQKYQVSKSVYEGNYLSLGIPSECRTNFQ